MVRILIMVPTRGGYDDSTLSSIKNSSQELNITALNCDEVYLHACRRKLLQQAMTLHQKDPYDYFMWLENRISFKPQDILNIINGQEGQIVSGLYSKYNHPMFYYGNSYTGYNFNNVVDYPMIRDRYKKVDGVGLGFMLIPANIIEHYCRSMPSTKWFRSEEWYPQNCPPDGQQNVVGEDLYFCDMLRSLGYEIILDSHTILVYDGVGPESWGEWDGVVVERYPVAELDLGPKHKATLTKRGMVSVGHICNLRCEFCQYAHLPSKHWRKLDDCKKDVDAAVGSGCNQIDIVGGEPTVYPYIIDLVKYCREAGLAPILATNCQAINSAESIKAFLDAGVEHFLCSVNAIGKVYNKLSGNDKAWGKMQSALNNFKSMGVSFKVNCWLVVDNIWQLSDIVNYTADRGAMSINFSVPIGSYDTQARLSEISPALIGALELCDSRGVECSVKHMPFCFLRGHFDKCYNSQQSQHDHGHCVNSVDDSSLYERSSRCGECALSAICDGLSKQYIDRFGDSELSPVDGPAVTDSTVFITEKKLVGHVS